MNRIHLFRLSKITFILILCLSSHAQGQVLIGPVVGGQLNWISYKEQSSKDIYSTSPVYGFHAGFSVVFRTHKKFFMQTSLVYYQRGKSITGIGDPTLIHKASYNYLDLPILFTREFNAKIGRNKFFKWYLGFGPNVSYWLGGTGYLKNSDLYENSINPPNNDITYSISFDKDRDSTPPDEMSIQNANRIQLGLSFSAGLIFEPVGLNKFMITARYELGGSYLSEESNGDFGNELGLVYTDDLQSRTNGFALSLYYLIDLKTETRKKGKSTLKIK
ncbi:MAG: outer membrane beta-barrel protein [Cyclobacteriaceae bacterium]|nr:outer membrane beta-barrel protein [Cyclobacteriaceae bacterium]